MIDWLLEFVIWLDEGGLMLILIAVAVAGPLVYALWWPARARRDRRLISDVARARKRD